MSLTDKCWKINQWKNSLLNSWLVLYNTYLDDEWSEILHGIDCRQIKACLDWFVIVIYAFWFRWVWERWQNNYNKEWCIKTGTRSQAQHKIMNERSRELWKCLSFRLEGRCMKKMMHIKAVHYTIFIFCPLLPSWKPTTEPRRRQAVLNIS